MTNQSNYNNQPNWKKSSSAKKSHASGSSASEGYQRFLEYLEQAGPTESLRRKIMQVHTLRKSKENGTNKNLKET